MNESGDAYASSDEAVLTGADIEMIRQGAAMLPGKWYLDPLIDTRRPKTRAWIRADEPADHRVDAIGLSRSVGLVFVTICQNDEDEREALPNMAFETLEGALASLRLYLESPVSRDTAGRARRKG